MLLKDVYLTVGLGSILLVLLVIFWKEIKLYIFDPTFAYTLGFSDKFLNGLISLMIVVTIVIGLESVGVVLMSTLLIAPAIAARQWSNRIHIVAIISGLIGFVSGVMGTFISSVGEQIPTGPTIVLIASLFVLLSILFAPNRGLVAMYFRNKKARKRLIERAKGTTKI
jgi:manganese/zinc/iron transport system permease protein